MNKISRKKRRKRIKKLIKIWRKYKYYIIAVAAAVVLTVTGVIVYACTHKEAATIEEAESQEDYSAIFDSEEKGGLFKKKDKKKKAEASVTGAAEEEIEYKTILDYKEDAKSGYMNNCIFLGDSRTVAMVSYGFVSDENVLAQVGISHPSVESNTFVQNSGKQYTLKSYLASHQAPVIYIGYGVNGMGGSDEKYEKSYTTLVEHIMEMAPDSKIVLMSIWPVDDYGTYKKTVKNEWVNKYNKFLEALAEHEEIYYLNVNEILTGSDGQIKPEYDAGDGLHYRACAYTVILDYIIHHPVPGIPDDGEFVVKYVKPTGDFKKMQKEKVPLPSNAQEVDASELLTPSPEVDEMLLTPSLTYIPEKKSDSKPTPTPTAPPASQPTPTPIPQNEPGPTPSPSPSPTVYPTSPAGDPTGDPTSDPTDEPTSDPTDEPTNEPTDEPTADPTDEPTADPNA